jgi:hypothetical protein
MMQAGQGGTDVNLIPVRTGNSFKKWNMSMNNGPPQGPGHYPHIPVTDVTGPTIKFTIVDPQGLEFDTANPLYVRAGNAKPGHEVDPQFTYALSADTHNNQNAVLTVTDSNQKAGPYNYVLNFNDAGPLDPIIDNTGPHIVGGSAGGGGADTYSAVWYAVGAIAIIAVIVVAVRMLQRRT